MVEGGRGGAIVNVSSVASQVALKEHTVYCESFLRDTSTRCSPPPSSGSSKAALDMLTKMMGLELGPHKVACSSASPCHS